MMERPRPAEEPFIADLRACVATWEHSNGHERFPAERLHTLARIGLLEAFVILDGPAAVSRLLLTLRMIGGVDLSLGRIFEGHVNAIQLVHAFGNAGQRKRLAQDLDDQRWFGVWNTEPQPGLSLAAGARGFVLTGAKSFATGAGHIDRALITARLPDGQKQLLLVDIAGKTERAQNEGWRVRGMRGTMSGLFDFTGMTLDTSALIGAPGDYELEPRFSAGAWRFSAVQLGGLTALVRHWRDHLLSSGNAGDPIQRARFAASVAATRSACLWVAQAAQLAETECPEAIACVLMARGVVEDAALQAMESAARAVGTSAFFDDSRIDRITRDLGLYLRQPVPDQARDRAAAAWLEADCWGDDPWW